MEAENHSLHEGEILGEKGGKQGVEQDNSNCQKSSVPSFVDVAFIVEYDEPLNLGCCQETSNSGSALPSERQKPSDDKREELLTTSRRKFGDPVVLTTW